MSKSPYNRRGVVDTRANRGGGTGGAHGPFRLAVAASSAPPASPLIKPIHGATLEIGPHSLQNSIYKGGPLPTIALPLLFQMVKFEPYSNPAAMTATNLV